MPKSKKEINLKHGMCYTRIYHIWAGMKQRCFDEKCKAYKNYGGRGITVCNRWLTFDYFLKDMVHSYSRDLTIERINVNGNYEPSNCKWVSKTDQSNNRRSNVNVTYNGKTQNLMLWSKELKLSVTTLYQRVKRGWNVEDLFNPNKFGNQHRKELAKLKLKQ